jgi:RND family efflux transporter MFP subunit
MSVSRHLIRGVRGLSPRAVAALVLLLTVAVTWVIAHEGHSPLPTKGAQVDVEKGLLTISPEARKSLDLRTAEVTAEPVEERILAYATLVTPWQQHAFASSRLPGRIVELHVRAGQTVKAGQPLAAVESLELENLQLELLNARNEVELSGKILAQLEPSVRSGAVAERILIEAQTKHRQNENGLEVAKSKWFSLNLSDTDLKALFAKGKPETARTLPVRSPVGGTVIHADLTAGKVVEPGEHLFEVVDLSTVWVQIGVLEKDLYRVGPGQRAELTLSAYPGQVFNATVKVIGPALDPQTHLNTVWAELSNPPGREPRFLPGMTGQAELVLAGRPAGRTLPAAAVYGDGASRYVLVEEASASNSTQLARRNVVVGRQSADRAEIVGGDLYPGDRVVTRGGHELAGFFIPGVLRLTPEAARNIGLKVEPAQAQTLGSVLEVNGTVDVPPDRRAFASSRLAGSLLKVHVDRGQAVRKGQVVAEVASLELQDIQLDLLKTHLEARLLEDTLKRLRSAEGAVPARQVLEAESQFSGVRNKRDSLRRKLLAVGLTVDQLEALLADKKLVEALPVRAPFDGVLVQFDKVLGQSIKAEEPLFAIHNVANALVEGHVSQRDLSGVRIGQSVRVRLVADPAYLGEGKVVRSGRVFGLENRTMAVWVELPDSADRRLKHGQLATLALVEAQSSPALAVPHSAVVSEGTRAFVFVRNPEGVFERKAVKTGRADDRFIEIAEGLRAGEMVAVGGAAQLQTAYAGLR